MHFPMHSAYALTYALPPLMHNYAQLCAFVPITYAVARATPIYPVTT